MVIGVGFEQALVPYLLIELLMTGHGEDAYIMESSKLIATSNQVMTICKLGKRSLAFEMFL